MEKREIDWRHKAACARCDDPEIFFHGGGGPMLAAMQFCSECEVREECLAFAVSQKIGYGIWGGTQPHERIPIDSYAKEPID